MYAWSIKRRFIYGGTALVILGLFFSFFYFQYFYKAPTCTDGVQNGDETGVDCGGSCKNICTSDALKPVTLWSKVFNISGDVYTAVAYVQNPNITTKNPRATYKFKIYDEAGTKILEKEGYTSIPKNKKFAVFETGIVIKGKKPKSVDFQFTNYSAWEKDQSPEPDIFVEYGTLLSTSTIPRITGKIHNRSISNIKAIELDVFVLDSKENVVAASQSFIDDLYKSTTQEFVFTWPKPFNLGVETCLNPLDIVVGLDKSGSMRSEAKDPPEPFSTVLSNAQDFIKNLTDEDQVSVISFGNSSKKESSLSSNKEVSILAVRSLSLGTTSENTNITAGLQSSIEELNSEKAKSDSKKVIVLLTDGIPTEPVDKSIPDYPTISAQKMAEEIKRLGVEIFTIGLGKDVSDGFLKSISTDDSHYFNAPTKDKLSSVYKEISNGLCPKKPNVITVIYRPL